MILIVYNYRMFLKFDMFIINMIFKISFYKYLINIGMIFYVAIDFML